MTKLLEELKAAADGACDAALAIADVAWAADVATDAACDAAADATCGAADVAADVAWAAWAACGAAYAAAFEARYAAYAARDAYLAELKKTQEGRTND
tara:strand:- start:38699 stop:38992 length:294 start_codon:yes stop_codon:yes gene_type:complete